MHLSLPDVLTQLSTYFSRSSPHRPLHLLPPSPLMVDEENQHTVRGRKKGPCLRIFLLTREKFFFGGWEIFPGSPCPPGGEFVSSPQRPLHSPRYDWPRDGRRSVPGVPGTQTAPESEWDHYREGVAVFRVSAPRPRLHL